MKHVNYPVVILKDTVIFPHTFAPLFVGREKSVNALNAGMIDGKMIVVAQKDAAKETVSVEDLYNYGVLVHVIQMVRLPDGTIKLLVEAVDKVRTHKYSDNGKYFTADAEIIKDTSNLDPIATEALVRSIISIFEDYIKLGRNKVNPEIVGALYEMKNPYLVASTVAVNLNVKLEKKQKLLEIHTLKEYLESIYRLIVTECDIIKTEQTIHRSVDEHMKKHQRDYYLKEQLTAIHKELGDEDAKEELVKLEERIKTIKMTKEAREKALIEIKRLKMMSAMSAEANISRTYLDWLMTVPWESFSKLKTDISHAEEILNRDHYALDKVKERVLEYLAVQKRVKKIKGSILCFVGPPGVGKTSLAKSIAEATGRKFARISLGGMRDEAEIRGHRRTYVGAMPGKLIQSMKKAGSSNPLILLDEIDKLGMDFRGDPSSALLEVLDSEQNQAFSDHYLEVEYDLSNVMFIATANSFNMPRPLLDRMEIINLSGYIEDEKVEIAKNHLLPKQLKEHGLSSKELALSDAVLREIINYYTREAGVRSLERQIAKICRKAVKELEESTKKKKVAISAKTLEKYLGVKKYQHNEAEEEHLVGVTTGLAYTEVGGDILQIEAVSLPGKGDIKITGKLGEVMQESAQAAFSYFRSRAESFKVLPDYYQKRDLHVHVPEGATPKDGPSAGIAMFTTIVSVMTGIAVKKNIAMTGEITLRGRVLPIGGLKEKLMAALRGGIDTVIIPEENIKDLKDIPDSIKGNLHIIPVKFADEVLKYALIKPIDGVNEQQIIKNLPKIEENLQNALITH